ncbi:hypothetical protein C5B93_01070 [Rathayibacter sp. AY1A2]|uniref:hypothetical protein n=1 Tax=Rathayibacter sp. AY1A2 TaxID=2080520 RepID=UPI000CE7B2A9|nr:hypothetical protein [Rathayibacter sp. AY1A2]PPF41333.1 hypothetical protein C5B93_01070 [Rathayibacter sp. AY1A2]
MLNTRLLPTPDAASSETTSLDLLTAPSPLEVDHAARFEGWATVVRLLARPVFEKDGYRFAGALVEDESARTFTIRMYAGSTIGDLQQMQLMLRRVREGLSGRLPWNGLADGRRVVTLSAEPFGGLLIPCREPACVNYRGAHVIGEDGSPWHQHTALKLEDDRWRVQVLRTDDEPEWIVELSVDDECSGDEAAALSLALSAAADEARRLNSRDGDG